MVTIRRIEQVVKSNKLSLLSDIDIDGEVFKLYVNIVGDEWHKYAVDDRADAFLFGVLSYAMRHGHDITCINPISGPFLFNLITQYIPTLSKHDDALYNTKINAKSIDTPIISEGAVATGLSCGVDCLHTVIENYNYSISKKLALTHFLVFNEGAFGGSFYSTNRAFAVKNIYLRESALAKELNLPIVNLETDLESLVKIPVDQFVVYAMGILVLSISKLVGVYHYSSSGGDYSDFSVVNSSKKDISYADVLSLHCISHGATYFYSAGGAKTRFEKFKTLVDNPLVQKHLYSCLNHDFNCGVCPKCYRNLLTIDAFGKLDSYSKIYDIEAYKRIRNDALEYLVREVVFHGYSYAYLVDIYALIKKREPKLIQSIESQLTINKVLFEKDRYKKMAEDRQKVLRAYKTLISDSEMDKLRKWFSAKGIKHVILYSYSYCTDLIVNISGKIGIEIDYIVEDVSSKKVIPRLPYSTVDYPKCDAIIICDIANPELVAKKLSERTKIPTFYAGEFLDLRATL